MVLGAPFFVSGRFLSILWLATPIRPADLCWYALASPTISANMHIYFEQSKATRAQMLEQIVLTRSPHLGEASSLPGNLVTSWSSIPPSTCLRHSQVNLAKMHVKRIRSALFGFPQITQLASPFQFILFRASLD